MTRKTGITVISLLALVFTLVLAGSSAAGKPAPPPPQALYPDVVEAVPDHLQIQNDHQREWLRFTTTHINFGPGNLQIRGGGQIAPCDIDGIHYDQCTVATQEILDANGNVVLTHPAGRRVLPSRAQPLAPVRSGGVQDQDRQPVHAAPRSRSGVKITFCFVDVVFTGVTGTREEGRRRARTSSATATSRGSPSAGATPTTSRRRCRSSR